MKKLLRTSVFLLLAGMAVTSCVMQRSVSESQSANNPDYRVSYLFEHDGCRDTVSTTRGRAVTCTSPLRAT